MDKIKILQQASKELAGILDKLRELGFDQRYMIQRLAEQSHTVCIDVLGLVPNLSHDASLILHTIHKEVSILMGMKVKDSKRAKESAVSEALYFLEHHINCAELEINNHIEEYMKQL